MDKADNRNPDRFPTTRWSLVDRAGDPGQPSGHVALGELLTHYLPALRVHLVVAKRIQADRAEDLLQSFIARKFLEENLAAKADRSRGRFRTYILTILDRFIISEFRRDSTVIRGSGQVINADAEDLAVFVGGDKPESDAFDLAWARQVLSEAVQRMDDECRASCRPDVWGVFEARLLGPMLEDRPMVEYPELIERFGFASPAHAANVLVTAKRTFQRHLRSVIGEYADSPEAVEEEIRDLLNILSCAGAGS